MSAYTYLPAYADVEYVDGKLQVARSVIQTTKNQALKQRWLKTIDILLDQRLALADVQKA